MNIFGKTHKLYHRFLRKAASSGLNMFSKVYWNSMAEEIDGKWGQERHDYKLLRSLISEIKPDRLLDIGCGAGRLIALYEDLGISEIVAQDISENALKIARERYTNQKILFIRKEITKLDFVYGYFDIVISNRVLQHISRDKIEKVLDKICNIGRYVYLNELSDSDMTDETRLLFKHDYTGLLEKREFQLYKKGKLEQQTWLLFRNRSAPT